MADYVLVDLPSAVHYVDTVTRARVAEFDKETGYASVGTEDIGRFTSLAAAQVEIIERLNVIVTPDPSSPAHSTGVGPYKDKQGNTYAVQLPQCNIIKNGVENVGWGFKLLWEPTHNDDAGVMYHHGPAKNPTAALWYATSPGTPAYVPADEGQTGVAADGRNPETNALPVADSASTTNGASVNFYGSTWTVASDVLKRDGTPFLSETDVDYALVFTETRTGLGSKLFWVTNGADWYYFSPGNGRAYYGTIDPRTSTLPPSGTFREWQTTATCTQGSNIISAIPAPEYATLQTGMWVMLLKPSSLTRGVLRTDKGPGGSYPARGVAGTSALGSGTAGEMKYDTSTGLVYICNGGTSWSWNGDRDITTRYLYALVLARSYHARIRTLLGGGSIAVEDVNGTVLPAQRTVFGGEFMVNNIPILQAAIDALAGGATGYQLPNALLPGAGQVIIDRDNFELTAVSQTAGFFTPRGVAYVGVQFEPFAAVNSKVTSMTFKGNYLLNDHSLNWAEGPTNGLYVNGSPSPVDDFNHPGGNHHGGCMQIAQGCNGVSLTNVWFHDYPNAVAATFCADVWYHNPHFRASAPYYDYTGWMISHNDCEGGGCEDADMVSTYSFKALEAFKARGNTSARAGGIVYRRNNVTNGLMASNNSHMFMQDNAFTWTANCHVANSYHAPHDFTVQISKNIGGGFGDLGNVVDGNTIHILGYTYKGVATKGGIEVNTDTFAIAPQLKRITHTCDVDFNPAVLTTLVDSGTSSFPYLSGCQALNAAKSEIGDVTTTGLSRRFQDWSQSQFTGVLGHHGASQSPGTAIHTDSRNLVPGKGEDYFIW